MITVHRINGAQDIEVYLVLLQESEPLHNPVKGPFPYRIFPAGIVQLPRSIDTNTNEEPVFPEKFAPIVVQQDSIRLDGVMDHHAGPAIFLLKEDRFLKEIQAKEGRLTPLPCEGNFRDAVCFDGLPDILFENFIRHAEPAPRVQVSLTKVEAIPAGKVTPGSGWFCHEMECRKTADRHDFRKIG
jgi:hypothetical protein